MQELIIIIGLALGLFAAGIVFGLVLKGIDRKFAAFYQARIGPPLVQPFYDLEKLTIKQSIIPENAVGWVFKGAPYLALISSGLLLIYILLPYFSYLAGSDNFFRQSSDLIVILYIMLIPTIALICGGFASGSPYSAVGSQREVVILMSVKVPLAIVVITFGWKMTQLMGSANPFSLLTVAANPIWSGMSPVGMMGAFLLLLTMLAVIPAETAKIPFDQAEAETEIAEGLLAEYSGKYLALFLLSDAVKSFALTALFVILFVPYTLGQLFGESLLSVSSTALFISEAVFFLLKVILAYFVVITTVRVAMARFKISQVASFFMVTLTIVSLTGYLLLYLDPLIANL